MNVHPNTTSGKTSEQIRLDYLPHAAPGPSKASSIFAIIALIAALIQPVWIVALVIHELDYKTPPVGEVTQVVWGLLPLSIACFFSVCFKAAGGRWLRDPLGFFSSILIAVELGFVVFILFVNWWRWLWN